MKTSSYYPVLLVEDVAATARFYCDHFRFKPLFEADWYVHLQSSEDKRVNLGLVRYDHDTVPPAARKPTDSLLLNFEVKDPDAVMRGSWRPACRSCARCATRSSASAISSRRIRTA